MIIECFVGLVFIGICIAVYTAVRAGVIGSNICAFGAATFFSCRFFSVIRRISGEQMLDNTAVNTMGLFDFVAH